MEKYDIIVTNSNTKGEIIENTFNIRLDAIQSHFRENHDTNRYADELKHLSTDIGRIANENDTGLLYLYRVVKRELSFLSNSITSTHHEVTDSFMAGV